MQTTKTRNLPIGAKCRMNVTIDGEEKKDAILEYGGMDGGYGKFFTEDGQLLNAKGSHKLVDGVRERA